MKRWTCLILCLVLALTTITAQAAQYTLAEKLNKQLDFGSGLKGSFTLEVSGDADWAKLLTPLNGVDIELRAIKSGKLFQYQVYALDGQAETQHGLTQLYGNETTLGFRSELLPDTLLTMATGGDPVDQLFGGGEGGNPGWYSAALNMLGVSSAAWESDWTPALSGYYTDIELWLKAYGASPSVVKDAKTGETVMMMHYDIPVAAVKAELNTMLSTMLQDSVLMTLLRAQMTPAQQEVYLNANLLSYYAQAIEALPMTGNVTLEREVSTKGEDRKTMLSFPLPTNDGGWKSFLMVQEGDDLSVSMESDAQTVTLVTKGSTVTAESASYQGILRIMPVAGQEAMVQSPLSAAFTMKSLHSTSVDNDTRSHDVTTWSLKVEPDLSHLAEDDPTRTSYMTFDPLTLDVTAHFHSKNADTSPTTLEINAALKLQDAEAALTATLKSTSPWVMQELPLTGGENMAALTAERKGVLLNTYAMNALMMFSNMIPASTATSSDLPLPEETAVPALETPTDEATATDMN